MALIRATIRNRLGDRSVYDFIIEYMSDLDTEPMLDRAHIGSIALCLNLDSETSGEGQSATSSYIKSSDGEWAPAAISNASLMNLMESLMAQKMLGMTGGSGGGGGRTSVNSGEFVLASDTYEPSPIQVLTDWDHMLIWTEESFLLGQRNISGAIIWKKSNSTLAYKVMYTNVSATAGVVTQMLSGGPLYYLQSGDERTLHFGTDVSFGVYVSGITYKWVAWKEGT